MAFSFALGIFVPSAPHPAFGALSLSKPKSTNRVTSSPRAGRVSRLRPRAKITLTLDTTVHRSRCSIRYTAVNPAKLRFCGRQWRLYLRSLCAAEGNLCDGHRSIFARPLPPCGTPIAIVGAPLGRKLKQGAREARFSKLRCTTRCDSIALVEPSCEAGTK